MSRDDQDQDLVAATLAAAPPPDVSAGFLARVNARIDAEAHAGWLGLADFRSWTLRLAPAAGAIALVAVFWTPAATVSVPAPSAAVTSTSSASDLAADWQTASGNELLEAALTATSGGR